MPHTALTTPRSANAVPLTISAAQNQIPHDQLGRFYREESEAGRKYVLDWIAVLEPLRTIKGREKMWKVVAHRIGEKPGTVKKRFYQYLDGIKGECHPFWEALIDRSRFPRRGDRGLDARFLDFWLGLREQQKRLNDGGRQAHRDLLAQLSLWEADPLNSRHVIPGYDKPPKRISHCEMSHQFVPAGWSYSNLINHKPRKVSLVNIIIGPKAASQYLPKNLATRAGLAYREIVFSDDQVYDNSVICFANGAKPMRPMGFNTLDYLTGNFETWGIQLTSQDETTGRRRELDQEFYVWTILGDLMKNGFRKDSRGTRLIREHATAKGYAHKDGYGMSFDEEIYNRTNGCVFVDHSGRFDAGMFAKMYFRGKGRAKQASGNFRYKAPLEALFRRVRTTSAGLLGHTSQNERLLGPEDQGHIDGYLRRTWKQLENLPAKEREIVWELLSLPKHKWSQFSYLMELVYKAINSRRDHRLEGWDECDHVIPGWRLPNYFNPEEPDAIISVHQWKKMDPKAQAHVIAVGQDYPIWLSPGEAAAMYRETERKKLGFLDYELILSMLPLAWAYPRRQGRDTGGVTVQADGTLIIRDRQRFGGDSLVYFGMCETPNGRIPLRPRDQYLVYICPFKTDEAILQTLEGRYFGYVKIDQRPCANDIAARLRAQGQIEEYRAAVTRDGERRAGPEIARRRADMEHNERVLSGEIRPTQAQLDAEADRQAEIHRHALAERGIVEVELEDEDRDAPFEPETGHRPSETDDIYDRLFATDDEID